MGLDMVTKFVGTKKFKKRIFLITDGEKETKFTETEMTDIVKTINTNDIKLNCITVDFCKDLVEDDSDSVDEETAVSTEPLEPK